MPPKAAQKRAEGFSLVAKFLVYDNKSSVAVGDSSFVKGA
jgi:hypothetical protein